jgi:AcrR family transcriptional regulator
VAAINYHFGGKENLYREFFRLSLGQRAKGIMEALNAVMSEDDPPDLRKVIKAYASSFLNQILSSKDTHNFLKLVTQEMSEEGLAVDILVNEAVLPLHKLMKTAICRARPDISGEKASMCIAGLAGQVLHFIRAKDIIKHTVGRDYNKEFIDDIIEHITEVSLKGIGE